MKNDTKNDVKKLYRSEKDSMLWGILGGLGEYFNMDSTVLRLGFIVIVLLTGVFPGIVAYIIAYFIIPERPMISVQSKAKSPKKKDEPIITPPPAPKPTPESRLNEIVNGKNNHAHTTPVVVPKKETQTVPLKIEDTPPAEMGELKKPNWPVATKELLPKVEAEKEPHTATLDALLEDESEVSLDDLIDAE